MRDPLEGQVSSITITAQLTTKQCGIYKIRNWSKEEKGEGMREYFTEEFS